MANGGIIGPVQTVQEGSTVSAKVTTFNSSGTFTAQATANVDYLIVAGGGGGAASSNGAGAGGAGGYRATGFGPSPLRGSAVPVTSGSPYPIVVGGGGAGFCGNPETTGNGTVEAIHLLFVLHQPVVEAVEVVVTE